jgi:hypothetical protein
VRGLRYVVAAAACVLLWPASAWGWTSPLDLSSHSQFANEAAVGMNVRGDTVVAWSDQVDEYHSTLYATVRPAGGGWGSTQTLSIPADLQNAYPSAAVDANGDTLVVWGATSSLGETRAAFAPAGQPFQSPVQVGATYDGSEGDAYPFVAFDDAGNAIAQQVPTHPPIPPRLIRTTPWRATGRRLPCGTARIPTGMPGTP